MSKPLNDEHELLRRIKPYTRDALMLDVLDLINLYEVRALEKLVESPSDEVKTLQGEVKSLRRLQARLKQRDVAVKTT